jgi:hypothetical protein
MVEEKIFGGGDIWWKRKQSKDAGNNKVYKRTLVLKGKQERNMKEEKKMKYRSGRRGKSWKGIGPPPPSTAPEHWKGASQPSFPP